MTETRTPASNIELIGGVACLDFTNTVGGDRAGRTRDYLNSYTDLLDWSHHAGLISVVEAQRLGQEAARRPAEADEVFARAIILREAIYRIFSATAAATPPEEEDLTILNHALAETLPRLQVKQSDEGFTWTWREEPQALDPMLWPLVRSAGELLTSPDLSKVRECAGDNCGWLFLDTSRNHSRRWCDMRDCGNRAKARRHYERVRSK